MESSTTGADQMVMKLTGKKVLVIETSSAPLHKNIMPTAILLRYRYHLTALINKVSVKLRS